MESSTTNNFDGIDAQSMANDTFMDIAVPLASDKEAGSVPPTQPPAPMQAGETRPRVIFCLPGREFSRHFLISWTRLLMTLTEAKVDVVMSQNANSMVHFARMNCLGGDNRKGKNQKPFQGEIPYNYLIWIDSDIVFNPEDVIRLLRSPHAVTAGYYRMENSMAFAAVKTWDEEYFAKNGTFEFLTEEAIKEYRDTTTQEYMPVDYTGMGMMCFRYGVLENLEYPWFASPITTIKTADGQEFHDIMSEDVYLCRKLKEAGTTIMLDTTIRVGHLKSVPL